MLRIFTFFLPMLLAMSFLQAQIDADWRTANDHGEYYEGRYSPVGGMDALKLVSLYAGFERYAGIPAPALNVDYYAPENGKAVITMEEVVPKGYNFLESKEKNSKKEWNSFRRSEEDSSAFITKIPYGNLGVLVSWGNKAQKDYLPAFVYHIDKPQFTRYLAHIRTAMEVESGSFTIYSIENKGKKKSEETELFTGRVGAVNANTFFPISFPSSRLIGHEGWVKVKLLVKTKGSSKEAEMTFHFYHHFE